MLKQTLISIRITLILLLIVCGAYPLLIWGVGQAAFHHQANGSLVMDSKGNVIGSDLLAQGFTKPQYFQPRPSSAGSGYDPTASGGTNLGPTSDKLINGASGFDGVKTLAATYRKTNGLAPTAEVPVDAVTRSASGLDPEVSVANAILQAQRVATARDVPVSAINQAIAAHTVGRSLGFLGEPGVNVLDLNLDLDRKYPVKG